jgi:hypothetical protein
LLAQQQHSCAHFGCAAKLLPALVGCFFWHIWLRLLRISRGSQHAGLLDRIIMAGCNNIAVASAATFLFGLSARCATLLFSAAVLLLLLLMHSFARLQLTAEHSPNNNCFVNCSQSAA